MVVYWLSDTNECRRLARNVITADFTDQQIQSYQIKVYSIIRTITNKDDWMDTDREFGALQLIETELVAELIKKHYSDLPEERGAADAAIQAALGELDKIVENMDTDSGEEGGSIQITDYKSWNLNPDTPVPNRLKNVGITEIDF